RYQRWLEDQLRASLNRDTESTEEDRKADRLSVHLEIAAGVCEYEGELATKKRRTWSGQAKLWEIMFGIDPDAALRMARQKAEEITELFRKAVIDSDPKAAGALVGPLLRTLGLPLDFWSELSLTSTGRRRSK